MAGTIEYLEEKELFSLLRSISNERDYLIIRLLFEIGCTLDELVSIRVRDIDTACGTILIRSHKPSKTQDRTVKISRKSCSTIEAYTTKAGLVEKRLSYLFQTARRTPLTPRRVFQIVENRFRLTKLSRKASPQIIKYTHIIHAYRNKVPMEEIERQVGIKKQRLAQIFEQITVKRDEDAYMEFFGKLEKIEDGK